MTAQRADGEDDGAAAIRGLEIERGSEAIGARIGSVAVLVQSGSRRWCRHPGRHRDSRFRGRTIDVAGAVRGRRSPSGMTFETIVLGSVRPNEMNVTAESPAEPAGKLSA